MFIFYPLPPFLLLTMYYSCLRYGCTLTLAIHAIGCILAFIVMQNCHRKKKKKLLLLLQAKPHSWWI